MASTYTVVQGDTLSKIASRYNTTVAKLVELNDITDPNFIVVGQVLKLSNDGGSTTTTVKKNTSSKAKIKAFGLQSGTDRTMYATWTWDKSNTDKYQIRWFYATGDGVGFIGNDTTVTDKQCTYNAPQNATHVSFYVKPISKTHKVNNKDTSYWTAEWSTKEVYYFKNNPPTTPPVPTVSIKGYKLTVSLANLNVNGTQIQFQIVRNDSSVFKTIKADIKTNSASASCSLDTGSKYKVRCRAIRDNLYSKWSDYSDNINTAPAAPQAIMSIKALSETEVQLDWDNVQNATSYEIQYTTERRYFDSSSDVTSTTVDASVVGHAEITGLETGDEYFFRVRAVNENGESAWTPIVSIALGKDPEAPTTWSSSTTVVAGKDLKLYWVHNAADGSSQTYAELEMYINGIRHTYTIKNSTDEDLKDKTSVYTVDTSVYTEGTNIYWRVRTAGVTKAYGDWSIQRIINIYMPPTLELSVTNSNGELFDTLTSFPFYIKGLAGPKSQKPIGYHVTISANEAYETVDNIGNVKMVSAGNAVYSKYFDTSDPLLIEMSAGNIDLENNIKYTISCTVSMNSGLTTKETSEFTVAWTDEYYVPNAEISYDPETYTTSIRPYCEDENEELIEGVMLSVYRREFDGTFTELGSELNNTDCTFITDPHPALDYARYRVVAITTNTGAVSYYDLPAYPIGEKAVIIQWDEAWTKFETTSEDPLDQPAWSGSLLRLPYNIDVSDSYSTDVSLVKYVGRKRPVTYYGTQLGETSNWNVEIPKDDIETLYALRRLAIWTDDVYVREPSGSGYWANISVSFNQTHCKLSIPVTISVTRVEGGA